MVRYEKDGKVLIIDEDDGKQVYYRTWVNGEYNGAWRKDRDDFDIEFAKWILSNQRRM